MQLIVILAVSIISYLGLVLGIILMKIAPEEQKPGQKFFYFFQFLLIVTIILFFFILMIARIDMIIISILFLGLIFWYKSKLNEKSKLFFFILGTILALSTLKANLFVIESTLILIYGTVTSSLLFNLKKKNYVNILTQNLTFFIPVLLVILLPFLVSNF